MTKNKEAKNWCFTLNNYTETDIEQLRSLKDHEHVQYIIFGKEKGEQGTEHLQGYISFKKKKRFNFVKEAVSNKAHIEVAKGNARQNREYCSKDGAHEEHGTLPNGQGHRSDLDHAADLCRQGKRLREIAEQAPSAFIRYGSGISKLQFYHRPDRRTATPDIHTFWGPTGTGKTRRVHEFLDKDELYIHSGERWFDGYDGHKAVLFDDFDGSWFKITYLLKLLDRYIFPVPIKGAHTWWYPDHIYITSNINPEDWYPTAKQEHKDALLRRLKEFGKIIHITQLEDPVPKKVEPQKTQHDSDTVIQQPTECLDHPLFDNVYLSLTQQIFPEKFDEERLQLEQDKDTFLS
ncbi:MAG: putative viral replication protein [Circoviridae sp.]|nr:MAG: putative viral replication protein [Circoviridae sp.]